MTTTVLLVRAGARTIVVRKTGPAGMSAYAEAVLQGFVGSEVEWLASLEGDVGATGATGAAGPEGDVGATGPAGPEGDVGPAGPQGAVGPAGPQGAVGPAGPEGDVGPQGPAGGIGPQGAVGPAGADGADGADGASGLQVRATATETTAVLAAGAQEAGSVAVPAAAAFRVYRVATDRAARVRLYTTNAKRDADAARNLVTDPVGDHGLILEVITEVGLLDLELSPAVDGYLPGAAGVIPSIIDNLSGASHTVEVELLYVRTE